MKKVVESYHAPIQHVKEFKSQVLSIIKGISSENEDVKRFALMKLCQLLETYSSYLIDMLTNADAIDPVIRELINTLLRSSKENNGEICNLIGKCFGKLGAIDPGRLDVSLNINDDYVALYLNIDDGTFACDVINELCRSFLAANNTRAQDCSAYAIQEILQYYGCTDQYSDR